MLRDLQSTLISKLVSIPGIITSTSKSKIHCTKAVHTCTKCGYNDVQRVKFGMTRVMAPGLCFNPAVSKDNKCGLGTFRFNSDLSEYCDQ